MRYNNLILFIVLILISSCENSEPSTPSGLGGSTARYAIMGDNLYVINNVSLHVYNLQNGNFSEVNEVHIGRGIETIFAQPDKLFLGANDGMHIYSISQPESPTFQFRYQHILACDPVVVQGTRAYVTLSTGTECGTDAINALEIIDITNPYDPQLVKRYTMESPIGLGVDGDLLFIAEGDNGLKMFDITNELDMKLIDHKKDVVVFDVIANDQTLTATGSKGIFQFHYQAGNDSKLTLLSKIPVAR